MTESNGTVLRFQTTTIIPGEGPPDVNTGNFGDFYIDTLNHDRYGPKGTAAEVDPWGAPTSMIGPQGIQGPDGLDLEFAWDGTRLGVRKEEETAYTYSDLVGPVGPIGQTGPVGPIGETGPIGQTGRGFNPRGEWDATLSYAVDDIATYLGATYRRAVAGTTAAAPPDDGANWELWADKGQTGDPGAGVPEGGTEGQFITRTATGSTTWVDPPQSLPAGGTEGQVLGKASAADFDTRWVDQDSGFGVANVVDFGAVGDGTTDDSAAIQAAIDSVTASRTRGLCVYFPPGDYYFTNTLMISRPNVIFEAASLVTLDYQGAAGSYAIQADLSGLPSGHPPSPFSMRNIRLCDSSAAGRTTTKTRHGLYLKLVVEGRFEGCVFEFFDQATRMEFNTLLNVFNTCRWWVNNTGISTTEGAVNDNVLLNPRFGYHAAVAYDLSVGRCTRNQFYGGDFESENAAPVARTGELEEWSGVRVERNLAGPWVEVGGGCSLRLSCHSAGNLSADPAVTFGGAGSRVELIERDGTSTALFDSDDNHLALVENSPASVSKAIRDEGARNVVSTPLGSASSTVLSPAHLANLVPADLTRWTASANAALTVEGSVGEMTTYRLQSQGANTEVSLSYSLTGAYDSLYVGLSGNALNNAGQMELYVNGSRCDRLTRPGERYRGYVAVKGPFTDPAIKLVTATVTSGTTILWGATVHDAHFAAG